MSADPNESMDTDLPVDSDEHFDINTLTEISIPDPLPVAPCGNDEHGRLLISHITNINFKSYAGTKIMGPFQKSFTCIVGPNGSGKSNVIDAMLFVFGFRANKIRSKKLSVLIHNSERHQNIQSCTVKVHFKRIRDTGEGDDDYEDVPNSEFAVSRTASKDNTSHYYIDDKKSTAKQVVQLLLSHGIDLDHNRFLILQGEVELISMMKPKAPTEHEEGMLEYLEDIIGSNRFKQPIDILNLRVDKISELRSEKLSRVKLAEKDKNALEGPKNEAIRFLTLENEISTKKNCIFQKYRFDVEKSLRTAEEKMGLVKKSNEEIEGKMAELEAQKAENKKQNKSVYKKFEKLKDVCEDKKAQYAELEQKQVKAEEDLKHLSPKVKKLEKALVTEEKKLSDLREAPERHAQEIQGLEDDQEMLLERKEQAEKDLNSAVDAIKSETEGLQVRKSKLEEQLLKHQGELNDKKSRAEVAKAELDLATSSYDSEKAALEKMMASHAQAKSAIKTNESLICQIQERLPKAEDELKRVSEELDQVKSQEHDLGTKLSTLNMKIKDFSAQIQSRRSQSAQLQGLLDQKNSGKIPGIVGRLGDLGAIDDKYDIAVSTACGPLDNIVVDTLKTGQACIQYLKRSNLGVCTFILLEKMGDWAEKSTRQINTPDNVPRLFDLIKFTDERLRGAFYYAVRDTLVATDLQQASRIAFGRQRYRVVTLAGQLIEVSGAMSGGGRPSKGRMGSAVISTNITPEKLREMEEKLVAGREKQSHHQSKGANLMNKKEALIKEMDSLKNQLDKSTLELRMYQDQTKQMKNEIKEQDAIVKKSVPDQKVVTKLEDVYMKFNTEYELIHSKTSGIEEESRDLHRQIVEIKEKKMKAAQANLDKAKKDYDQNKVKVNKLNVAIKSNSRNLSRAEEKVKSIQEELEDAATQRRDVTSSQQTYREQSEAMMLQYNESMEQYKAAEEEVKKISGFIEEIEKQQNELKGSVLESKRDLEKYMATVKECQGKRNHWQRELEKLMIHRIPDETNVTELETLSTEQLEDVDLKSSQYEVTVLEEQLSLMKPNMNVIEEYRRKENQYIERVGELDQVTEVRNRQRGVLDEMKKQRLHEFMSGFSIITGKLKEMYQMITLGGDAELELVDTLDPFSEGIVFSVRPPKKSWKNISNLSGGEKTLSSLSLVFALHHYRPTPLYVMDEIDAALDFKNVSIVANYIKERTKNAQFIIISLRDNMFEKASRLVGIYKTHDSTKTTVLSYRDDTCTTAPPMAV